MPQTKVNSLGITDNTIVNADINSSAAIAYSKLNLTGGIGISDLSATGTPSASTFLRGDNTWGAVSSDYVLLATTDVTSSTASVSFDGYFSSTYKNYKIIVSYAIPVNDDVYLYMRYRRSNADVTASSYWWVNGGFYLQNDGGSGASDYYTLGTINTSYAQLGRFIGNTTSYGGFSFDGTIFNPLNTTTYKQITLNGLNTRANNVFLYSTFNTSTLKDSTAALSGLTFYFSSGNIASGNFKLYGIK